MSNRKKNSVGRRLIAMLGGLKEDEHEITLRQIATLGVAVETPGVSIRDIATMLGLNKPSCTRAVDALVARGFVKREASKEDRRLIKIQPTTAGEAFAARFTTGIGHG